MDETQEPSPTPPEENGAGTGERPGNTLGSMIGAIALGTIIAALGTFFCFALWVGYEKAKLSRTWDEVPCVIERSWVETKILGPSNSPPSYRHRIEYSYSYKGKDYTGKKVKRAEGGTSMKSKAQENVKKYPEGLETVCYVNPDDPTFAILQHDSKAALYTIWFPGVFVIAGLGISITGIRGWLRRRRLPK